MLDTIRENSSAAINSTLREYNTLEYPIRLLFLLNQIFPQTDFADYSKFDLHKLFNDLYLKEYHNEEVLKFKLFEKLENKKKLVAGFEMPTLNSRVDFITINGRTTSYEIKSELDNLSKLKKQANDYAKAFEYNYIVLDVKHKLKAERLIPDSFGVMTFRNGRLYRSKKALLNKEIQSTAQLEILSKKELYDGFSLREKEDIINSFCCKDINRIFKELLKKRYKVKWNFLLQNKDDILPIDLQFFFKTNLSPKDIYLQ